MLNNYLKPMPTNESFTPWGPWASIGFSVLVFFAASLLAGVPIALLMILKGTRHLPGSIDSLSVIVSGPLIVGMIWALCRAKTRDKIREYLGLLPFNFKNIAIWFGITMACNIVYFQAAKLFGFNYELEMQKMIEMYKSCGSYMPLFWIATIVIAPLWEEVLFRGFLFKGFTNSRLGTAGAILIPSLIWAVIHFQYSIFGIVQIMILGIIFSLARIRGNSLYIPIILHMINNTIAMVALHYLTYQPL